MLVAGVHVSDALRWFSGAREFEAADPVEVFATAGGYRKGRRESCDPLHNTWVRDVPPMEYEGLELALVKFANGVVGKVSVNFDCVLSYRFPLGIFGDRGSAFDNRVWSHKFPRQQGWVEMPTILPDSVDVSHHPFQGQMDHFVDCLQHGVESHCSLEDAIKTHEVAFGALRSRRTKRPGRLSSQSKSAEEEWWDRASRPGALLSGVPPWRKAYGTTEAAHRLPGNPQNRSSRQPVNNSILREAVRGWARSA